MVQGYYQADYQDITACLIPEVLFLISLSTALVLIAVLGGAIVALALDAIALAAALAAGIHDDDGVPHTPL